MYTWIKIADAYCHAFLHSPVFYPGETEQFCIVNVCLCTQNMKSYQFIALWVKHELQCNLLTQISISKVEGKAHF